MERARGADQGGAGGNLAGTTTKERANSEEQRQRRKTSRQTDQRQSSVSPVVSLPPVVTFVVYRLSRLSCAVPFLASRRFTLTPRLSVCEWRAARTRICGSRRSCSSMCNSPAEVSRDESTQTAARELDAGAVERRRRPAAAAAAAHSCLACALRTRLLLLSTHRVGGG